MSAAIFSSPVGMYRKLCCTAPSVSIGTCDSGGSGSGDGQNVKIFRLNFLCDGQGTDRQATLHADRSC